MRSRTARQAALLTWLVLGSSALLGTLPLTAQLARILGRQPEGARLLFDGGGSLLLDLLAQEAVTLSTATRSSAWLLLGSMFALSWARAVLWSALDRLDAPLARAARTGLACLPNFLLAWVLTRVLQALAFLIPLLLLAPALNAVGFSSERTEDLCLLAALGLGAIVAVLLQFAWSVCACQLARGNELAASLGATIAVLRRGRMPWWSWLGYGTLGALLPPLLAAAFATVPTDIPTAWTLLGHQLAIAAGVVAHTSAACVVVEWTQRARDPAVEKSVDSGG